MADLISFPRYDQRTFVPRSETQDVQRLVASIATGHRGEIRAVDFSGEPGVGKSWLLRHLAEAEVTLHDAEQPIGNALGDAPVGGTPGVRSLYVNLEDWRGNPEDTAKALILAVDRRVSDWAQLLTPTASLGGGEAASLADLSRWLEADVRTLLEGAAQALVLLLDYAHEAPWRLLELFDKHVVGPLAAIPRVFTVTAGRGKAYPWEAVDLRLHTHTIEISPFDVKQTHRQLKEQIDKEFSLEDAREIWEITKGYPRSNYALGAMGKTEWPKAIDAELQYLLEVVSGPGLGGQLQKHLMALCVLRRFRDDQILPMLAGYYNDPAREQESIAKAVSIRKALVQYDLVRWDDTRPAMWKIHDRLRSLLLGALADDRPLAIRMNCKASEIFLRYAELYENTRDLWLDEALYHEKQLAKLKAGLADCPQ